MLPVCGEFTWLDVFNLVQLVYTVIALIETCVVLFLFFNKVTLTLTLNPNRLTLNPNPTLNPHPHP